MRNIQKLFWPPFWNGIMFFFFNYFSNVNLFIFSFFEPPILRFRRQYKTGPLSIVVTNVPSAKGWISHQDYFSLSLSLSFSQRMLFSSACRGRRGRQKIIESYRIKEFPSSRYCQSFCLAIIRCEMYSDLLYEMYKAFLTKVERNLQRS